MLPTSKALWTKWGSHLKIKVRCAWFSHVSLQLGPTCPQFRILRPCTEHRKLLERLPMVRAKNTGWNAGRCCLAGTRQAQLDKIFQWVHDEGQGQVFWLTGVAGSGKSTIANTIARTFANLKRLGGNFFFNRDVDGLNNTDSAISTLTRQLAGFSEELGKRICDVIRKDPASLPHRRGLNAPADCRNYSGCQLCRTGSARPRCVGREWGRGSSKQSP